MASMRITSPPRSLAILLGVVALAKVTYLCIVMHSFQSLPSAAYAPSLPEIANGSSREEAITVHHRGDDMRWHGPSSASRASRASRQLVTGNTSDSANERKYHEDEGVEYRDRGGSSTTAHTVVGVGVGVGIPRTLHYLWPNRNFTYDADHPFEQSETKARVANIRSLNPNWNVVIWTDDDCYTFMKERYPEFYVHWIELRPKLKMWDAVRPAILYDQGGIYLDHDIDCAGVGFDEWIQPQTRLLIRQPITEGKFVGREILGNHFMGSTKGHPIWKTYMNNIVLASQSNKTRAGVQLDVVRHTGPRQFYQTLVQYRDETKMAAAAVVRQTSSSSSSFSSTEIRVLDSDELGNCFHDRARCPAKCVHAMGISPAEIDGEDDNSEGQIIASRKRNKRWEEKQRNGDSAGVGQQLKSSTTGSRTGKKRLRPSRSGQDIQMQNTNATGGIGAADYMDMDSGGGYYTKPKCDPCKRLRLYVGVGKGAKGAKGAMTDEKIPKQQPVVVFVHIPKTGGTTLETLMGVKGSCHATATAIRDCDSAAYDTSLSFAALRNPLDRAVSIYRYAREGGNGSRNDRDKFRWASLLNFTSFIGEISKRPHLQRDFFYAPQVHFIAAAGGTSFNASDSDEEKRPSSFKVNELICSEDLSGGWERLRRLAPHLDKLGEFPKNKYRVSKSQSSEVTVDAPTVLKLREIYRDDYQLWEKHCAGAAGRPEPELREDREDRYQGGEIAAVEHLYDDSQVGQGGRLVWFLHFHKAGGTSFTDLAALNDEIKRKPPRIPEALNDPHSHIELNRGKKIRWPLIAGVEGGESNGIIRPASCGDGLHSPPIDLGRELQDVMDAGVTFVSSEHWFPPLPHLSEGAMAAGVKLVTILRDPVERVLSSYYFHDCASRCPGSQRKRKCRLTEWSDAETNMYTRMLNGQPFGPNMLPRNCTFEYSRRPMGQKNFDLAVSALGQFDLVLTLSSFGDVRREKAAQCALRRVLGWEKTALPASNVARPSKKSCPVRNDPSEVPAKASEAEIEKVREKNEWDLMLYQRARIIEEDLLKKLGCLTQPN